MFSEDLTLFFSTSGFADSATLAGVSVVGIFSKAYQLADLAGAGMASTAPVLTLPSADVPDEPVGETVVHDDVSYTVVATEPGGTGITRLVLEAQQ